MEKALPLPADIRPYLGYEVQILGLGVGMICHLRPVWVFSRFGQDWKFEERYGLYTETRKNTQVTKRSVKWSLKNVGSARK